MADIGSANWGTTAYATAVDSNSLSFAATDDATFEVWVYPTASPTDASSNTFPICAKWQASQTREYYWVYYKSGADYKIEFAGTTNNGVTTDTNTWTITQLPENTWSYLAVVYTDSTGVYELFIGDEDTTPVSQGTFSGGTGIGQGSGGTSRFGMAFGDNTYGGTWEGLFGEFRMWSAARTLTELQNNYAPDAISSGTGLKEVWRFDDTSSFSGTALINGNTLTGVNSPTGSSNIPVISGGSTPTTKAKYHQLSMLGVG